MSLVLTCLYSELKQPALAHIVSELAKVPYLADIIIGLDRADEAQYRHALSYFSALPQRHHVLWNDGPRLQAVQRKLSDEGFAPPEPGKGANVWRCFGYVQALGTAKAVALHDCDITTYGIVFEPGTIRTAKACYYRIALDLIESYASDAAMNGLALDRHAEEQAVELFATNLLKAGEAYLEGGEETPFMPAWHRVTSVYRNVHDDLLAAVAAGAADFC